MLSVTTYTHPIRTLLSKENPRAKRELRGNKVWLTSDEARQKIDDYYADDPSYSAHLLPT